MSMQIVLNEAEQRLAKYLAAKRHANARSKGIANSKIGTQSDEETDLEGIASEIAWCKANNVYPDLTIAEGDIPDVDAISRTGQRVDIKSTKYQSGHLVAARWKGAGKVDVYCLVIGKFPRYRIAGYMDSEELLNDRMLKDFGHGKGYAARQDQLRGVL